MHAIERTDQPKLFYGITFGPLSFKYLPALHP